MTLLHLAQSDIRMSLLANNFIHLFQQYNVIGNENTIYRFVTNTPRNTPHPPLLTSNNPSDRSESFPVVGHTSIENRSR